MNQKVLSTNKTLNHIITCEIMDTRLLGFVCLILHNTNLRTHHTHVYLISQTQGHIVRPTLKYNFNDLILDILVLNHFWIVLRPDRSMALEYFNFLQRINRLLTKN